ncbi:aromatic amino acid transport family protein [Campylobacter pinnipediorum]|uniref:aromatic amino acid transport family protein n=1 Tax=Campylobacter pinnipediorum TaxID=1965231 RepID=UPI00084D8734|nr:aromatic amino acid transport family protein [Campylobacter pinnipediorum]
MKINSFHARWMLSLFGTAVGAGILFLPIRAGTGGFWPIVIMCFLVFPMTYLSHKNLARFVNSGSKPQMDITQVVTEHFGQGWGVAITFLYFFAIFPICLAYGVGITNTVNSFIVHQLGFAEPNRFILAFALVSAMMFVLVFSEEIVTKICSALVYPLCAILLAFSLYLMPHWKFDTIANVPAMGDFLGVIWLTLPVLVFSFNHSPIVSTFAQSVQREYPNDTDANAGKIEFGASVILLVFVMIFVFSSVLCLNPDDFAKARTANIPVLSYFANEFDSPIIAYAGPLVALLAIASSFFGHYYGAYEGLCGILHKTKGKDGKPNSRAVKIGATIFLYISTVVVGYINPSILGFIEDLGGPIIAAILFIMPIITIYRIPAMAKFKNPLFDGFVFLMGALTILSVVYGKMV